MSQLILIDEDKLKDLQHKADFGNEIKSLLIDAGNEFNYISDTGSQYSYAYVVFNKMYQDLMFHKFHR